MQYFKLNGTIYRITLVPVFSNWQDCSADTIERFNPDSKEWLESDMNVSHVRSFGTPVQWTMHINN